MATEQLSLTPRLIIRPETSG